MEKYSHDSEWNERFLTIGDIRRFLAKNEWLEDSTKILIMEEDNNGCTSIDGYCKKMNLSSDYDENKILCLKF